ncbi:glycoside hydrolase family 73 protein [Sphingomonas bacterium]|uniref:glycoside hydrolase family 73 protein n=1 Tax=Sphingomonas bacterium TaxID=1895847 RepID=UPI0015751F1C|nr:glucosaminidase domain-containing protein [Sphingomonas bacterium]
MTNPKIAIDIVANDRSGKGVTSAEKRIGTIPQHAGAANRRMLRDGEAAVKRSSRGILGSFSSIEKASAGVLGGKSMTSGLVKGLDETRKATSGVVTGMVEAESAIGAVGIAVGATVGIVAAAAYGAFKLADGWSKGAASIGRTAETIGVSTKALQEFSAAAERAGVDKDKATGGLGSLSQNLSDARYGRNSATLATLGRLGVQMKLGANGDVDVGAMLPAIADAIARQGSSGRRTVARNLGIGLDVLPAFSQGGKALSADMVDADSHAAVLDDGQIATGRRISRKGATVGQLADRAMSAAGAAAAGATESGYDAALSGGRALSDGTASLGGVIRSTFAPAADKIAAGGRAIERAASGLTSAVISVAQRVAGRHGQRASIALAQYGVESSYGRHMPAGSNNPFGIKAHGDQPFVLARTREEDGHGHSRFEMAKFRKFGSIEEAFEERAKLLDGRRYARVKGAGSADEAADALHDSGYATDHSYAPKLKREIHGHGLDRYDGAPIPVKVEIDARGLPAGTRTKVTAGHGSRPAISHALAHG